MALLLPALGVSAPAAALDTESYARAAEALFLPLAGGNPVSCRPKPQLRRAQGKVSLTCRDIGVPLGNSGVVLSIPSLRLDFDEDAGGDLPFTGNLPGSIVLRLTDREGLRVAMGRPVLTGALDPQSGRVVRAVFTAEKLAAGIAGNPLEIGAFRYEFGLAPAKEGGLAETLRLAMDDVRIGAFAAFRNGSYSGTTVYETAEAFDLAQSEGGGASPGPAEAEDSEEGGMTLTGLRLRLPESSLALTVDALQLAARLEPSAPGEELAFDARIGFSGVKSDWQDFTVENGRLHLGLDEVKAEKMRMFLAGKPGSGALFDRASVDLAGERIRLAGARLERAHFAVSAKDLGEETGSAKLSGRASGLRRPGKDGTAGGAPVGAGVELEIEDLPTSLFRPGHAKDALLTQLDKAGTAVAIMEFSLGAGQGQAGLSGRLGFDTDVSFGVTGQLDAMVRSYDALAAGLLGLAPEDGLARWRRAAALIRDAGVNAAGSALAYALRIEPNGAGSVNGKELDSLLTRIEE